MSKTSAIKKAESKSLAIASFKLMVSQYNPFISREKYNKLLSECFDAMSEGMLAGYASQIGDFLHLKKKDSSLYKNTSWQVDGIMREFPRLIRYREFVLEAVKEHRKKCKLDV